MPYVLLNVVNYPRMGLAEGNLGWTSSNELLFTIPVDWYERKKGKWVFKAQAQFAPFIFVNDEASQVEGREVYGWPKVQGWLTASSENQWIKSPRNMRNLLNMTTRVFDKLYAEKDFKPQQFLSIAQEAPPSFSELPPTPGNPMNLLNTLPKAVAEWTSVLGDLVQWGVNSTLSGSFSIQETLANSINSLANFTTQVSGNTINLKQIRDAQVPKNACYQALTNAVMNVTQIHAMGMLGDFAPTER